MQSILRLASIAAAAAAVLSPSADADISHRKGALSVLVQAPSGEPIEGAEVRIEMLNHAFRFGTSIEHRHIDPASAEYDAWTVEQMQRYFNSLTYGNIMKWSYFEARDPEVMQEIAALARSYAAFDGPDSMRLRGHATIWGASYQVPVDVRNSSDPDYIRDRVHDHIADYHATFKDSGIDSFDLYNEHFHESALLIDKIVPSGELAAQAAEVAAWFNKAKEADPEARLFINDYNILNFWNANDADVIAYKAFVDAVRDAGGKVDGIGLQGHMDRPTTTKADILRRFDILSAPMAPTANHPEGLPGVRLEVTELDMNVSNPASNNPSWVNATPEQQAAITERVLEAAFEHPAVDGVTIWGLNDYLHWRDNAIMYDDLDYNDSARVRKEPILKQSGQVWIDHVLGEWWEDHDGHTDAEGSFTAFTFKGSHRVTVTVDGEEQVKIVDLEEAESVEFEFSRTAAGASTYDAWAGLIEWASGGDAERDADPDGDGRSNFSEFVEATDPLVADQPRSARLYQLDQNELRLVYSLRASRAGLIIELEKSSDLADWEKVAEQELDESVDASAGLSTFSLRMPASAEPLFFKLSVVEATAP